MAEWLIAPVLKTGIVLNKNYRGFESLSLLFCSLNRFVSLLVFPNGYRKEGGMARLSHRARPKRDYDYINELKKKKKKDLKKDFKNDPIPRCMME